MLTNDEYNNLWNYNPTGAGSFRSITGLIHPPNYQEYVIRENMFEDFLDIFRGKNTRNKRLCTSEILNYLHPFFNDAGTIILEKPSIKYVLIGEAAPKKKEDNNELELIKQLTYIYNIEISGGGQYITSILNAFKQKDPEKTVDRLIEIAKQEVILFDIFPFALNYTPKIRETLNKSGLTEYFYNSCLERIKKIIGSINKQTESKPMSTYTSAFVSPPIICNYLADKVISQEYENLNFDTKKNELGGMSTKIENGTIKVSILLNNKYDVGGQKQIPYYKCCCYSGAKTVPHATFIKNALDLDL